MQELLTQWKQATGELKPGVQRVFIDVLTLASEGKATLAFGTDYYKGKPCLVNAVGPMLTTGGGAGIPVTNFKDVVHLFDEINHTFAKKGINKNGQLVSDTAALVLLRNFGELKPMPVGVVFDEFVEAEAVKALDTNVECPVETKAIEPARKWIS